MSVRLAVLAVIVAAVAVALAAASGPASASAVETGFIQATLQSDGSGQMIVNSQTNPPGETWSWQACAKNETKCMPLTGERTASTSGAGAGTVFIATANDGPKVTSPIWNGTVTAITPPSVSGQVQANALVTPVGGTWTGGWEGDFDLLQLAACTYPDGTGCIALTAPPFYEGCPNGAAVIDPMFIGRYLRVADQKEGVNTVFAAYALDSPYGAAVWAPSPTTSTAVVGQIAFATGPPQAACGPPIFSPRKDRPPGVTPGHNPKDTPPPGVARRQCRVPNLKHKTLFQVRKRLARSTCKLGKVVKPRGQTRFKRRVVNQRPAAGKVLPAGTKISIRLT